MVTYAVWRFVVEGAAGILLFVLYKDFWIRIMTIVGIIGVVACTATFNWYTTSNLFWHHLGLGFSLIVATQIVRYGFPFAIGAVGRKP